MKHHLFIFISMCLLAIGCSRAVVQDVQMQNGSANAAENSADVPAAKALENANNGGNDMAQNLDMTMDEFGNETDHFLTKSGKKVSIHAIVHGSLWFEYDGLQFQVDPVSKLNDKVTDYAKMPKADVILLTHEHFDHLDAAAIQNLAKDSTLILTNDSCAEKLNKGEKMHNGDVKNIREDVRVEAVPAYNTTKGHEKFHPKGRDNGFIVTLDGLRIYISGDTEDIPEMAGFKDVDVALMSCNQPYTMTPAQLAHAAEMVKPKVLFPYHYGDTSISEVKSLLDGKKIDLRIRQYQ